MTSRFRLALLSGVLALAGCGEPGPGSFDYAAHPLLTRDEQDDPALKGKPNLKGKPRLQGVVSKALDDLYGANPQQIKVPPGSGLPAGGAYLARRVVAGESRQAEPRPVAFLDDQGRKVPIEGGYALYRRHCLHCHGVGGDGNGPTGPYLWPRPRDFRPGTFKFTRTNSKKPTRDDLRRTILEGIPNSAMPAFNELMTRAEMEQVIDYLIFLSIRGESEEKLIVLASASEEKDAATALIPEDVRDVLTGIFESWKAAETDVFNPPVPRVASSPESIARGRTLFLGRHPNPSKKTECIGCHGLKADGNGASFVDLKVFQHVTFGGSPDHLLQRLREWDAKTQDLWWTGSVDDWGQPLRAANLNKGMYKGGRRPIDLYWRIAKGINGAKMPAHATLLEPNEIWDVVNFILALPQQPELLKDVAPAPSPPPAVAHR